MKIEVVPAADEIRHEQIVNRVVIMIDVLRASSTIVSALSAGFDEVLPVETIGQAYALRNEHTVLAGERHCKKIADFDYNNSPTALISSKHTGKRLVLTTTNGTRAIQHAEKADALLIGCLLNASACIQAALRLGLDLTLYCAGTRGQFAQEDGLAAGCMIHRAKQLVPQAQACDLGQILEAAYLHLADDLPNVLRQTATGRRLAQHFSADIRYCSQVDCQAIVPVVKERRILATPVS